MPRRRDRLGTTAVGPVGRATGGRPTSHAAGALDRRSHTRTCGWLLDLHFRSANAASNVVVRLALAGRPLGNCPRRRSGRLSAATGCAKPTIRRSPAVTTTQSTWLPH
jgi:hypothetical protein